MGDHPIERGFFLVSRVVYQFGLAVG